MPLSEKETTLLKDLKGQEKLCIEKYTKAADSAIDPQLKDLFNQLANVEKNHLSTIEQMEKGTVLTQNSSGAMTMQSFTPTYSMGDTPEKTADCFLSDAGTAGWSYSSDLAVQG